MVSLEDKIGRRKKKKRQNKYGLDQNRIQNFSQLLRKNPSVDIRDRFCSRFPSENNDIPFNSFRDLLPNNPMNSARRADGGLDETNMIILEDWWWQYYSYLLLFVRQYFLVFDLIIGG